MTFPKLLALVACILFSVIGIAALFKGGKSSHPTSKEAIAKPIEIQLEAPSKREQKIVSDKEAAKKGNKNSSSSKEPAAKGASTATKPLATPQVAILPRTSDADLPDADRIEEFFNRGEGKAQLPIVKTIIYKSRVPWQKGRPAWLSDYAAHYSTSRHFIARSLNGKPDYFKQDIAEGDRFNVLDPDKNFEFYLLIDTSRNKLWFYYIDLDTQEKVLVKTYKVGLGRLDSTKASGMLTPLGKFSLGSKIAIYKPKVMGFHNGQKTEMIKVFGTRWIPFDKEIGETTAKAAGFGIHGVPWTVGAKGELTENVESIGQYESDGCIRLATQDIEEIFAIVITRPTTVELVKDFYEANPQ
jgi:hypothetical protein